MIYLKKLKYTIGITLGIILVFFIMNYIYYTQANLVDDTTTKMLYDLSNVISETEIFNKYIIKYSSNAVVKGVITYTIDGIEEQERFYLEPAKNQTFSSFISGYIDDREINKNDLLSIEFERIDKNNGSFSIDSVQLVSYPKVTDLINSINGNISEIASIYNEQKTIFFKNDNIKLGISLKYGGSINYISGDSDIFSSNFSNINLINNYDNGRFIQQCYYGNQTYLADGKPYVSGDCDNIDGLYNPIQGGYVQRNCAGIINPTIEYNSKIIDITVSDDKRMVTIKTKPSLWELTNETYKTDYNDYYGGYTADAYMISKYTIYDTYIDVSNSYIDFTSNFNDSYNSGYARSESPSVYLISALDEFYSYDMKNSSLEKISFGEADINGFQSINNGNVYYSNWGGYFSTNSDTNLTEGLGIYHPNYDGSYQYITGFYAGPNKSNSSTASSTSFFTTIIHLNSGKIEQFKKFSYDYIITLGNINDINKIMNTYRKDHSYNLKVDPNGGMLNNSNDITVFEPNLLAYWGNLHSIGMATRVGYKLKGYYDSKVGGNLVYDSSGLAVNSVYWKVNSDNLVNDSLVEQKYEYIGNQDLVVYAQWESKIDTNYKVKHYKMALDGKTYLNPEIENMTGTSGMEITPQTKIYEGFVSPLVQTVNINGDGSTVVEYYYERNKYELNLIKGTGISAVTGAGKYFFEEEVKLNATVLIGYTFSGWSNEDANTIITYKMPANDTTLTASATVNKYQIKYDLDGGSVSEANPSTYTVENANITLNPPNKIGYIFKEWQVNGIKSDGIIKKGSTGDITFTAIYELAPSSSDEYVYFDENIEIDANYIKKLDANITVANLLSKVEKLNNETSIVIYDSMEREKELNSVLSTGDKLIVYNRDIKVDEYTVSILGDINGDGKTSVSDVSKLFQYYRQKITMEDIYIISGDVTDDSEIKLSDIAKLFQYVREKISSLR